MAYPPDNLSPLHNVLTTMKTICNHRPIIHSPPHSGSAGAEVLSGRFTPPALRANLSHNFHRMRHSLKYMNLLLPLCQTVTAQSKAVQTAGRKTHTHLSSLYLALQSSPYQRSESSLCVSDFLILTWKS